MTGQAPTPPDPGSRPASSEGIADALRTAVDRTMRATAGSAQNNRERAVGLLDEIARRGRQARDELARRGQEAGAGLARRGQEATGEVGRRLELLERRLSELERRLASESGIQSPRSTGTQANPNSKAEG